MTNTKPVPNLIRYGLSNGFIGADLESLFLGGDARYAEEETREIKITNENRSEVVAVLRQLPDFVEGKGTSSNTPAEEPAGQSYDDGPLGEERQV